MPRKTYMNQNKKEAFEMLENLELVVEILVDCLAPEELNKINPALRTLRDSITAIRSKLKSGRNKGN